MKILQIIASRYIPVKANPPAGFAGHVVLCSLSVLCYQPRWETVRLALPYFMSLWIRALAKCLKWKVWMYKRIIHGSAKLTVKPVTSRCHPHPRTQKCFQLPSLLHSYLSVHVVKPGARAVGLIKTKVALKMGELRTPVEENDGQIEEALCLNPGLKQRWTLQDETKEGGKGYLNLSVTSVCSCFGLKFHLHGEF